MAFGDVPATHVTQATERYRRLRQTIINQTENKVLYPSLMIDLETLSSEPNAPIIQIGAVPFDIVTGAVGPVLNVTVKPDFSKTPPSLSTICWWLRQSDEARATISDADHAMPVEEGLAILREFIRDNCEPKFDVWAMPPEFDLVILANTMRAHMARIPWAYNRTRDLRTLESLVGCSSVDRVKATVAHVAGEDAKAQALTAIAYRRKLFGVGQ